MMSNVALSYSIVYEIGVWLRGRLLLRHHVENDFGDMEVLQANGMMW
jgi:hypothetical protein